MDRNAEFLTKKASAGKNDLQTVGLKSEPAFATQCIECGKCEQHCPQNIPIRQMIKEADRVVRPWPYKIGINIVRKFFLKK